MTDGGAGDRQRLLASVLAGELPADAPAVLAAGRADPTFATELRELLELQSVLRQRARTVQEDLREPAGELHGAAARALPASRPRAGARRAGWWLAAAALLTALGFALWPSPARPAAPQYLGGVGVRATADNRALEFVFELAAGQSFRVIVLDGAGNEVAATERLATRIWTPAPELVARWSDAWTVRIEVVGGDVPPPRAGEVRHWRPAAKND